MTDEQVTALLHALMVEVDAPADPDVDEAWLAEAERRDREFESGTVQSIPAEDVFAEARIMLARGTRGCE
jgi:hypothetical protein